MQKEGSRHFAREEKKEQENNMSFLTFCSLSKVGARMKINKVVHIHGNDLIGWQTPFPLKICEFSFLPRAHSSARNRWLPELSSSKFLKVFAKNVTDERWGHLVARVSFQKYCKIFCVCRISACALQRAYSAVLVTT